MSSVKPGKPLHTARPSAQWIARRLQPGQLAAAYVGDEEVVVARLGSGKLAVFNDYCPHDAGLLSDGFVEGERVVCARHQWEFDAGDKALTHCPAHFGPEHVCKPVRAMWTIAPAQHPDEGTLSPLSPSASTEPDDTSDG